MSRGGSAVIADDNALRWFPLWGTIMMKPLLNWISGIFLAATWVAFALTVLVMPSAQAQTYTKTILHDYTGQLDGESPSTRLILDQAGNLYGITPTGGIYNEGTIFEIDLSGHYTILYSFGANVRSAAFPIGRLTMDAAGNLYGTSVGGGFFGVGTVFKFDTSGTFTVLYSFNGGQFGGLPEGGLLYVESEGRFFGSTSGGGILSATAATAAALCINWRRTQAAGGRLRSCTPSPGRRTEHFLRKS